MNHRADYIPGLVKRHSLLTVTVVTLALCNMAACSAGISSSVDARVQKKRSVRRRVRLDSALVKEMNASWREAYAAYTRIESPEAAVGLLRIYDWWPTDEAVVAKLLRKYPGPVSAWLALKWIWHHGRVPDFVSDAGIPLEVLQARGPYVPGLRAFFAISRHPSDFRIQSGWNMVVPAQRGMHPQVLHTMVKIYCSKGGTVSISVLGRRPSRILWDGSLFSSTGYDHTGVIYTVRHSVTPGEHGVLWQSVLIPGHPRPAALALFSDAGCRFSDGRPVPPMRNYYLSIYDRATVLALRGKWASARRLMRSRLSYPRQAVLAAYVLGWILSREPYLSSHSLKVILMGLLKRYPSSGLRNTASIIDDSTSPGIRKSEKCAHAEYCSLPALLNFYYRTRQSADFSSTASVLRAINQKDPASRIPADYFLSHGMYGEALRSASHPRLSLLRARAFLGLGNTSAALSAAGDSLFSADVLYSLGRTRQARGTLEAYLREHPSDSVALRAYFSMWPTMTPRPPSARDIMAAKKEWPDEPVIYLHRELHTRLYATGGGYNIFRAAILVQDPHALHSITIPQEAIALFTGVWAPGASYPVWAYPVSRGVYEPKGVTAGSVVEFAWAAPVSPPSGMPGVMLGRRFYAYDMNAPVLHASYVLEVPADVVPDVNVTGGLNSSITDMPGGRRLYRVSGDYISVPPSEKRQYNPVAYQPSVMVSVGISKATLLRLMASEHPYVVRHSLELDGFAARWRGHESEMLDWIRRNIQPDNSITNPVEILESRRGSRVIFAYNMLKLLNKSARILYASPRRIVAEPMSHGLDLSPFYLPLLMIEGRGVIDMRYVMAPPGMVVPAYSRAWALDPLGPSLFFRLPSSDGGTRTTRINMTVHPDKTATMRIHEVLTGAAAWFRYEKLRRAGGSRRLLVVLNSSRAVSRFYPGGIMRKFRYEVKGGELVLDYILDVPGVASCLPSSCRLRKYGFPWSLIRKYASETRRLTPFLPPALPRVEEHITISLPGAVRRDALDYTIRSRFGFMERHTTWTDDSVTVHIRKGLSSEPVSPEKWNEFRQFCISFDEWENMDISYVLPSVGSH